VPIRFVADSAGEVAKVAMAAQGSEVLIPIGRSGGRLTRGSSANSKLVIHLRALDIGGGLPAANEGSFPNLAATGTPSLGPWSAISAAILRS
jgi:hypothetical protein